MQRNLPRFARCIFESKPQLLCANYRCLSSSTAALLDFLSRQSAKSLGYNSLELSSATAQSSGLRQSSWRSFATDAASGQKADTKPSRAAGREDSEAGAAGKSDRVLIPRVHRPPPNAKAAPAQGRAEGGLRPAARGATDTRSTLDAKKEYRQLRAEKAREDARRVAAEQAAASATLAAKQAAREEQKRKAAEELEAPRQKLLSKKALGEQLNGLDINSYITLRRDLLPEVFFSEPQPQFQRMLPKGGCPGLMEELEATKSDSIMFRYCMEHLLKIATKRGRRRRTGRRHVYLTGPASSGKSIALAFVVSQLRAQGWLVLYVPAALQLTHGGTFGRHAISGWDNPECAKLVLHNVLASHKTQLDALKSSDGSRSLADVADAGLEATDPSQVVDAAIELKEELARVNVPGMPVLIAIDDYQALYAPSQYGEWLSQHHRRVVPAEEVRLANAMRVLEQPPLANGLVITAAQRAGSYSPKLRMPMPKTAPFTITRMMTPEWESLTNYYKVQGTTTPVAEEGVQKMFFLTLGNPKEYRKIADCMTL